MTAREQLPSSRPVIAHALDTYYDGASTGRTLLERYAAEERAAALAEAIARLKSIPVTCTALTGAVWFGQGWKDAIGELEEFARYDQPAWLAAAGQAPAPQPSGIAAVAREIRPGTGVAYDQAPAPQPETAPDAACARCSHPAADHGPRGCRFELCSCPRDAAGVSAYWPLIDPGAARWQQHGTTWVRDEYGNAHSLGTATAPDAEPGAPHTNTGDLGERRRRFLADAITAHGPGHQWRTGDVVKLFNADGDEVCRNTARRMLAGLADDGLLRRVDTAGGRYWVAAGQDGGTR